MGPDPKNGLAYIVGHTAWNGKIKITRISLDTEVVRVYKVFAKSTEEENPAEFLWKEFVGMPVMVDMDIENY